MRKTRLTTTLVAVALAAAGCGNASSTDSPGDGGGTHQPPGGPAVTPHQFADALLAKVMLPAGVARSAHAPTKALDHLPESPSLRHPPTVLAKYWSVDKGAAAILDWLRSSHPDGLVGLGSAESSQPAQPPLHYLAYRSASLPDSIGAGYVYVAVASTGPGRSAIGAWAVTAAQPKRPVAEQVPLDLSKAVIGWSLAPGGTPVLKTLRGDAAQKLARDFNALRVDTQGIEPCPLIPTQNGDVVVTFTADGHSWKVDVPACPDLRVSRDGHALPSLAFGKAFMADVRSYTGGLPRLGPPQKKGAVVPLEQPATPR